MKIPFETVKNIPLFSGIGSGDLEKMLCCMDARTQSYQKDEIVLLTGGKADFVGLILSGGVTIIKEDIDGNISIITELSAPELFGEVLACADIERSPVTVQASEKSVILLINYRKVLAICSSACGFHSKMIENMLRLIAKKSLLLNQKLEILSKRTTREKLLAFFDAQRNMADTFSIPYNREELARYLCVDRSAMSHELCKMRDEGILRFHKNVFEIINAG